MMSQMGSVEPPVPLDRCGTLFSAVAVLVKFMSAMLTYFAFMLQKRCYRRKDSADVVLFLSVASWGDPIGPFRPFSYRVLPRDVKCWRRPEKSAITAASRLRRWR